MRRLIVVAALLLAVGTVLAAYEEKSGQDAEGSAWTKLANKSVAAPFQYWCRTVSPAGYADSESANVRRYKVHHRMVVIPNQLVPIARVDLIHTNTGTDTLAFKIYNGTIPDSMVWISSSVGLVSFPIIGDSIAFKPYKTSAAADWFIITYFER
jgi:hypothetical protein